jgi:hypothetical protein
MGKSKKQAKNRGKEEAPLPLPTVFPTYPFRDNSVDFVEGGGDYLITGEDYIALRDTIGFRPNKSKLKVFLEQRCNISDIKDYSFPAITETLRCYLEGNINNSQNDLKSDSDATLRPSEEKAYQSYKHAIDKKPEFADATDQEIHDWLNENGIEEYSPPAFDTWARHVRAGRKHYGTSKNTPRAGRTSKSAIHVTDPAVNQITDKFKKA